MCCVLGEGYNVCKTVLHTVNPIYMLGVLVAVFIILCFMWSSTFNIFLWQRFQPHILFCPSQKQQCSIMLNFSTRLKGHALFGREGVTVRKILGLAQTIAKLHKPLSTPSCCSAGVLLCWHSSCLPVLFVTLSFGGNHSENKTQATNGNLSLFAVEILGKEGRSQEEMCECIFKNHLQNILKKSNEGVIKGSLVP